MADQEKLAYFPQALYERMLRQCGVTQPQVIQILHEYALVSLQRGLSPDPSSPPEERAKVLSKLRQLGVDEEVIERMLAHSLGANSL